MFLIENEEDGIVCVEDVEIIDIFLDIFVYWKFF